MPLGAFHEPLAAHKSLLSTNYTVDSGNNHLPQLLSAQSRTLFSLGFATLGIPHRHQTYARVSFQGQSNARVYSVQANPRRAQ